MATSAAAIRNPKGNWAVLGSLWMVYGIMRIVVAILMIVYSSVATVMFGALLARVSDVLPLMTLFHFFYAVAIIVTAFAGIFGILAGLALLGGRSSARALALVASFLSVSDLPLGTTLGIYTLIVFLP